MSARGRNTGRGWLRAGCLALTAALGVFSASADRIWQQVATTGPSARNRTAMGYDFLRQQVILFGGYAGTTMGDTWAWNGDYWWQPQVQTAPPARLFHMMSGTEPGYGDIVMFGGGAAAMNDTWEWQWVIPNLRGTWIQNSALPAPWARYAGAMAYDPYGGAAILFGGGGHSSAGADTWEYFGAPPQWTQVFVTGPSARSYHAMASDRARNQIVLFGGMLHGGGAVGNAETWVCVWDGNQYQWIQRFPQTSPPGRYGHAMAYHPTLGKVILFGGLPSWPGTVLQDTWEWDGNNWTQMSPLSSPPGRVFTSMCEDYRYGRVIVFGGESQTGSRYGDTWAYYDCTPVTITAHPQSQSVCSGSLVTFSVTATGTAPLSYQWRKNGTSIGGATGSSYTIASVVLGDAGNYDCVVTNSCGSATSNGATLTVNTAPAITTHPQTQAVCSGGSVTFTVAASGIPAPTYQWRKDGSNISGATASSYTIDPVNPSHAGNYDCVVANTCGSATSNAATLTVHQGLQLTDPPDSTAVPAGAPASFSVVASGTGSLSYQWRRNGVGLSDGPAPGGGQIVGAQSATLTITAVGCGDAGQYDVVLVDDCGTLISPIAALTVSPSPCPLPGGDRVTGTYQIVGPGNGTPWSWRVVSNNGLFLDTPTIDVPGVQGTELDVAQAFADSINAYATAQGCSTDSMVAQARSIFGTVILSITVGCNSVFTLYVGPAGGPANCQVDVTLPACSFNPSIEKLPLPGADCNANGFDDFIDIQTGYSHDVNGNGIPDECEAHPGDLNCDSVVNFADINPFVLALSGQVAYQTVYPNCRWLNADCNGDGTVSFADINAFVALLSGQ